MLISIYIVCTKCNIIRLDISAFDEPIELQRSYKSIQYLRNNYNLGITLFNRTHDEFGSFAKSRTTQLGIANENNNTKSSKNIHIYIYSVLQ